MRNVALGTLMIFVGVAAERLLAARFKWQRADRIFWAVMTAMGAAIVWIKWVEPKLISALIGILVIRPFWR